MINSKDLVYVAAFAVCPHCGAERTSPESEGPITFNRAKALASRLSRENTTQSSNPIHGYETLLGTVPLNQRDLIGPVVDAAWDMIKGFDLHACPVPRMKPGVLFMAGVPYRGLAIRPADEKA